ncbi:MAG: single-stranded DNA-binding protein [Acidobacteria bacterium]|nr:single-stranded DNA-binding protein [Acidobacteriota bacterium]MCW5968009.1 single-stranded DNA-binding protein [Blastocatellales bacterium]
MSFNKIIIVGNLGRDPETRHTPQGNVVCKFSVATSERRKGADGQTEETTTWFRVSVWGRQAELAQEYLTKGRQVYVEGRLRLEEYTDREGNKRISPEVNATDIQFIGQRPEGSEGADRRSMTAGAGAAAPPAQARTEKAGRVVVEEDDIPF